MSDIFIRNALPEEFSAIGKIMVEAYSSLHDFPKADELPQYYDNLANIGTLTEHPQTELLIAVNQNNEVLGGVLYISDLKYYGVTKLNMEYPKTSAFRLLAVSVNTSGLGVGKSLIFACIDKAKKADHKQLIIHSTKSMAIARAIYTKLGFKRFEEIDFIQDNVEVFGFKLDLNGYDYSSYL